MFITKEYEYLTVNMCKSCRETVGKVVVSQQGSYLLETIPHRTALLVSCSPAMIRYIDVVGRWVDKQMHKMDDMVQDDMIQVINH